MSITADIKMIVTDLDGTLLRSDKTVGEYTSSVFRLCRGAGYKTVFATARPIRALKRWLKLEIENDACIYHNGAVIEINGKIIKETKIDYRIANKLLEAAKKIKDLKISVEINDTLYANFDASAIWPETEFTYSDLTDLPKHSADKILIGSVDKAVADDLKSFLDESLYWDISENQVLMIMNRQSRKLNAVKDTAAYFGLSLSNVAAFGDDYNDIEMLRECGVGVAVANAIPEAKSAAGYTCGCCDEDGVAKWIERNLLN